jgi:hypothetical protein
MRTDDANSLGISPVLQMLGVQYVILRGTPPQSVTPAFQSPDYWVLENGSALPRPSVPRHVEVVPDQEEMLRRLGRPEFDPRQVAYVERVITLPAQCRGTATITDEIPSRVVVTAQMETPGLLVLADAWDQGWRAYVNGRRVPILRANYALRGVVLPAGSATIEFRYQPASVRLAFCLAGAAAMILSGWTAVALWAGRKTLGQSDNCHTGPKAQHLEEPLA